MRRKLDLAASIIVAPDLLFLDEPTTSLDPRSRSALWDIVRDIVTDGTMVLLSTQNLDEADKLADKIRVIDHGRVIAAGTRGELKNSVGSAGIRIRLLDLAHWDRARDLIADHRIVVYDEPDPAVISARIPAQQRAETGCRRTCAPPRPARISARSPSPRCTCSMTSGLRRSPTGRCTGSCMSAGSRTGSAATAARWPSW